MMTQPMRCELITWNTVYRLSRALARKSRDADFRPDVIVAIARGGYVPARILCDLLDIGALASFRIMHYTAGAHREQAARIRYPLAVDLRGLNVLVVDDVSDTGDTLELALQHVAERGAAAIKVAVLHHKTVSSFQPDFFAAKVVKWRWIIYPWAVVEDITGFIRRMAQPPSSVQEAAQCLERDYGLRVPRSTLEDAYSLLSR